ncbi:MAG TPA: hypothetical protein VGD98_10775 [Ktedonobacteraceae bacterium]
MAAYFPSGQQGADPLVSPGPKGFSRPATRSNWWFRLTAPQESDNATFAQREAVRRGQVASLTVVYISIYTLLPLPLAHNLGFFVTQIVTFFINAFALIALNRRGHLIAAGWLVVTVLDAGFALAFLAIPGGVSLGLMPAFDLMAASLLAVVAFFPPRSVFIVMTINIIFIAGWITFGDHTAEIAHLLQTNPYTLFYPPIGLELFIAILIYFWVSSATRAITALDRSEEIVALERREIEQQETQLTLKRQLEDGIEQILQTHVKAANGDFAARAPLNRDNVLWRISYSLNNLLSRLQRYSQLQTEMERTQYAIKNLTEHVRSAKASNQPLPPLQRTGTMIDELIVELVSPAGADNASLTKRLSPSQLTNEKLPNVFPDEPQKTPRFPPARKPRY